MLMFFESNLLRHPFVYVILFFLHVFGSWLRSEEFPMGEHISPPLH